MNAPSWLEAGRMDALGRLDSPVHRLDPRAKILATAVFVAVVMSWPRHATSALLPMFAFPWLTGARAGLPTGFLLRKALFAAPFALAVAIGNPLFDRSPVTVAGNWQIAGGWLSFVSILLRFALTVWSALVLVASTGIHPLCAGMERLGMPPVFATQILFLHRYLFLIADEGFRLRRAVALRGAERIGPKVYSSLLGRWLLRAMDRAGRIHRAMLARGFDGQVRVLPGGRPGPRDFAFALGWIAFFAVARNWNLAEALARPLQHLLP
jgi:cobalt/nickel transport system permease protein